MTETSEGFDIPKIREDIVQQERTLQALEREAQANRDLLSLERRNAMAQALEEKKRHLSELKEQSNSLSSEAYEDHVREILAEVISLQDAFEFVLKKGLTNAKLQMLHDGLDAAQERLQEFDGRTEEPARSVERRTLITLMNKLRSTYPATMRGTKLMAVRDLHERVKAAYSSISHTLGEDTRRAYRARIAQMTNLVRRAESAHNREASINLASRDYFKSPAFIRAAASLAMARAATAAPVITAAVSRTKKEGILSSIVKAFKLM